MPSQHTSVSHGHSCVLCQQRKVKCDRQVPCANCLKSGANCVQSVPRQRRRRRAVAAEDLASRLRKCEKILKERGIDIDRDDSASPQKEALPVSFAHDRHKTPEEAPHQGKLLIQGGNKFYVENALWQDLDQVVRPEDITVCSDEELDDNASLCPDPGTLLLGHRSTTIKLSTMHPPPVQIFRLWQVYLKNVNPLIKVFHALTTQEIILDASGDLENLSKPKEAFMFSIYLLATISMRDEDLQSTLGESRRSLISKYSKATQQALINAKYLESLDLMVLQALTLFLTAMRKYFPLNTFWILTGSLVRIGQRLGLHRDVVSPAISPFEGEMRRRTWWQIVFLEGFACRMAGAGFPTTLSHFETSLPLNVADSDLHPGMAELPPDREGITEMVCVRLRCTVAQMFRNCNNFTSQKDIIGHYSANSTPVATKDEVVDHLERDLYAKYLKHCDESVPLHAAAISMVQGIISMLRLRAHHPSQYQDRGSTLPQSERDLLFKLSLNILEWEIKIHTDPMFQGFLWHIHDHFPLDAFMYHLEALQQLTTGQLAQNSWNVIETIFGHRPELIADPSSTLRYAVGNLALKAWVQREQSQDPPSETPRFINQLRAKRQGPRPALADTSFETAITQSMVLGQESTAVLTEQWTPASTEWSSDIPNLDPADWEYWHGILGDNIPSYL